MMNDSSPSPPDTGERPPRSGVRLVCWFLLAVVVTLGVLSLAALNPPTPTEPVTLVRGEEGWTQRDPAGSSVTLQSQIGRINAHNSASTTSSSSTMGESRIACRSVAIKNHSDHLLMRRLGPLLMERLRELEGVDQIDYYPPGHRPPVGGLGPDQWVDLYLDRIDVSGVTQRDLRAELRVEFGNSLNRCRSHYSGTSSRPLARLHCVSSVSHESTTIGVGTPSSRYKLAAENLAAEIGKQMTGKLNEATEKYGSLPNLPEAFYPPYQPTPEIPLGDAAELLASHRGLMLVNETLWRLDLDGPVADGPVADWLTALDGRLTADGWKQVILQTDPMTIRHLRATRGDEVLTAYPVERTGTPITERPEPTFGQVHYMRRMPVEQQQAAYESLIVGEPSMQSVTFVVDRLQGEGLKRLREHLELRDDLSAEAWVFLARMQRLDAPDAASESLRNASVMAWTEKDASDVDGKIKTLAKQLGWDPPRPAPPTAERLDALGFTRLDSPRAPAGRVVTEGEPLRYYYAGAPSRGGGLRVMTLTMRGGSLHKIDRGEGGWSSGTGGRNATAHFADSGSVSIRFEPVDGEGESSTERWRVTHRVTPAEAPADTPTETVE